MSLDKSPEIIEQMFNSLADRYDLMNDIMTGFSHRKTRKFAVKLSNYQENQRGLDLATGTGDLAFLLMNKAKGTIIGIDISEKMIIRAKKRSNSIDPSKRPVFQIVDINQLPYLDATFDFCTICYGIRNVPHPLQTMKEIARVTKKTGKFIIVEATPPGRRIIRFLSHFHFSKLVPLLARIFSSNSEAYNYLAESIIHFPPPELFRLLLKKAGWKKVTHYTMYLGTVTIFLAFK